MSEIKLFATNLKNKIVEYERVRKALATEASNDLVDSVIDRNIQTGKNADGDFYGAYSDSYLETKGKRGRLSTNVPEPHPNWFDQGDMWKQTKAILVSADPIFIYRIDADGDRQEIMEYINSNEKWEGTPITRFNAEELNEALQPFRDFFNTLIQ